eukprot:Nitzschia sp. Nitz4//scaffold47_size129522//95515//96906//NITZ4_003564-RA/size129522-processed-gene-0.17-mRNA-1//1//CDS//3329552839//6625//frame0
MSSHTDLLPSPGYSSVGLVGGMQNQSPSAMEDTAIQHYTIGDNLRAKGFYEDAIDEFQKALHIQEPLLGDAPVVANTHYALGLAFRATKNFKQALYHLQKASNAYENQPIPESKEDKPKSGFVLHPFKKEITNCKLNMARTHHSQGVQMQRSADYDRSISEHRKALAIREHLLGRTHLETARSYYVIGCALSDRGDFDEALSELRRALRTRLLIFGRNHMDTKEVVGNLATVLSAKGSMTDEEIAQYRQTVLQTLDLENEGDQLCRKGDYSNGLVCYRKALSMEEQILGDLHPTTCDIYLRMADALGQLGDPESSFVEYKCAIQIYERLMGKFHVKVANIYNKLAGILMDKGEYETALSFYAKSYGIYDAVLGNHDDTKQAMMNLRLAAARERSAKESMGLIKKAEESFKMQQEERRRQEAEILKQEAEMVDAINAERGTKPTDPADLVIPAPAPEPESEDII